MSFTDSPLVAGSTVIKAAHINELRQCIADLRAQKSLPTPSWTDPEIVPQQTSVKAAHVTEMRTALHEVYVAGGQPTPSYTAAPVAGLTTIQATHFNELRIAAQSAPQGPCVEVSPTDFGAPVSGSSGTFVVVSSCSWTAVSSASWLTVTPSSGNGAETLQFTVSPNSGATRSAHIDVGGTLFAVTQSGSGTTGELIVNGHFESGFVTATPSAGIVGNGWSPTYESHLLNQDGVEGDRAQYAESGGISQWVTMPPNQIYVLTADVHLNGGSVTVYMDKEGGGIPTVQTMNHAGGHRVWIPFSHQQSAATEVLVQFAETYAASGTEFRVDNVSLRPIADVLADERVVNGRFEVFREFSDGQSAGNLGAHWTRFGTASSAVTFSESEGFQFVQYAHQGDGIGQNVTVVPGQRYHLRASIKGWSGSARLGIGPVGSPATHSVGWCGGGGVAHTLSLIYTPPVGQTSVTVSVAGDWEPGDAAFYVDEVSLLPTTLLYVEPGAPQGECVPRHTLTLAVHDASNLEPVGNALVEITPSWGTGPARTTFSDGNISYLVGAGALQVTVSKYGYQTAYLTIDIATETTWAVELSPNGMPPDLTGPRSAKISAAAAPNPALSGTIDWVCSWRVSRNNGSQIPFIGVGMTLVIKVDGSTVAQQFFSGATSVFGAVSYRSAPATHDRTITCTGTGSYNAAGQTGQASATIPATVACTVPSSETVASGGWEPNTLSLHLFNQQLESAIPGFSFAGRTVAEHDAPGGVDSCHFPGSLYEPVTKLAPSGSSWEVMPDNSWGPDTVGWYPQVAFYYQEERIRRGLSLPCEASTPQRMTISCGVQTPRTYAQHVLRTMIDRYQIGVQKSSVVVWQNWQ